MSAPPVVALEIGTQSVIALVGEMREDGQIMVTGMGEAASQGISKGLVTDLDAATEATRIALAQAEESGRVSIRAVCLAVSGGHIQSAINSGVVPVLDAEGEITQADIDKVREVAKAISLSPDREIMHTICQHFVIDGRQRVVQPEGMEGARLGLDMMIIHGFRTALRNSSKVVENLRVDVADVVFAGLCSAIAVLSPEQKKGGTLVIDLGAGTTDYVAFVGGVIACAGVLGVGGDHVSNDIALAFGLPTRHAERCKCDAGSALLPEPGSDSNVAVAPGVGFAGRSIPMRDLAAVIHARMDEIFGMIRRRLDSADVLGRLGGGVLLTGGGAALPGACELAGDVFGAPCRIGKPHGISGLATATEGPRYAACGGLIHYGFRKASGRPRGGPLPGWLKGILGR